MAGSSVAMNPRTEPAVGRKMSPRGSLGFGSIATCMS
jgi:hypothetical protein